MSEKFKSGEFCWNELMASDVDKARDFYCELFGWEHSEIPMGEQTYTVFKVGEQEVAGMMSNGGATPQWMSYIKVDNVDDTVEKVLQLKGDVRVPVTEIPNVGRFAIIADTTGATFSIWQSTR